MSEVFVKLSQLNNKRKLIKIRNNDHKCFEWSHKAYLNLVSKYPKKIIIWNKDFIKKLNNGNFVFPMSHRDNYHKI